LNAAWMNRLFALSIVLNSLTSLILPSIATDNWEFTVRLMNKSWWNTNHRTALRSLLVTRTLTAVFNSQTLK
jgi:hypothetical protein